jgi:hypothetical protein
VTDSLTVTRDGAVAMLTIDRPEQRNAMTASCGDVEIATVCDLRFTDLIGVFGVAPAEVGIVYTPASRSALSQRATKAVVAALAEGRDGASAAQRWYGETVASGGASKV